MKVPRLFVNPSVGSLLSLSLFLSIASRTNLDQGIGTSSGWASIGSFVCLFVCSTGTHYCESSRLERPSPFDGLWNFVYTTSRAEKLRSGGYLISYTVYVHAGEPGILGANDKLSTKLEPGGGSRRISFGIFADSCDQVQLDRRMLAKVRRFVWEKLDVINFAFALDKLSSYHSSGIYLRSIVTSNKMTWHWK